MTDTQTRGGFAGDPAAALTVTGTGGCCGNPPSEAGNPPSQAGNQLSETAAAALPGAGGPCCGTSAEATAADACCGTSAKAEAVSAGAGCCG